MVQASELSRCEILQIAAGAASLAALPRRDGGGGVVHRSRSDEVQIIRKEIHS
jgi:hypothetical protein